MTWQHIQYQQLAEPVPVNFADIIPSVFVDAWQGDLDQPVLKPSTIYLMESVFHVFTDLPVSPPFNIFGWEHQQDVPLIRVRELRYLHPFTFEPDYTFLETDADDDALVAGGFFMGMQHPFGQNINRVGPVSRSDFFPLFTNQVFNDVTTEVNSQSDGDQAAANPQGFDCGSWNAFELYLDIQSTSNPTNIEFFVEFSPDGGTTWFHYAVGLFASLVYDDVVTANGLLQVFRGQIVGNKWRVRIVATGTTDTLLFTTSVKVQFARE